MKGRLGDAHNTTLSFGARTFDLPKVTKSPESDEAWGAYTMDGTSVVASSGAATSKVPVKYSGVTVITGGTLALSGKNTVGGSATINGGQLGVHGTVDYGVAGREESTISGSQNRYLGLPSSVVGKPGTEQQNFVSNFDKAGATGMQPGYFKPVGENVGSGYLLISNGVDHAYGSNKNNDDIAVVGGSGGQQQQKAKELMDSARKDLDSQQYKEAADKYRKALVVDPNNDPAKLLLQYSNDRNNFRKYQEIANDRSSQTRRQGYRRRESSDSVHRLTCLSERFRCGNAQSCGRGDGTWFEHAGFDIADNSACGSPAICNPGAGAGSCGAKDHPQWGCGV